MIEAKIICDSIGDHSPRLTTFLCRYPKFIHAEHMRHREPFLHVNCLMTITESRLLNFFGLRLDKSAQPEIRVLAETMWREWNEGNPKKLEPGQWHLPFVEDENDIGLSIPHDLKDRGWTENLLKTARMVSVARCARLIYSSFETNKKSTVVEDLKLYDRLIGSCPIHASPAEHQATPDQWFDFVDESVGESHWQHPELAGNLGPGWVQYRKMLPREAVAPLPEGYSHA